jgi:hypothetical protein
MGTKVTGLQELAGRLRASPAEMQKASREATIIASKILVSEVRSNIRGAPRWGHRGKSKVYRENITVSSAKGEGGSGGMPGRLSGDLIKGVGYKKVLTGTTTTVVGGVGIGKAVNNLKKRYLEEEFPFFSPAVQASEVDVHAAYEAAWLAAARASLE